MKKLFFLSAITLSSLSFAQSVPSTSSETVEDLVPSPEEQSSLLCNSKAIDREIKQIGNAISVKCTGASGLYFLYAVPIGGGGNNIPGTDTGLTNPGDR